MVCERLRDVLKIDFYYKAYNITLNKKGLKKEIDKLEYTKTKEELNNTVCKRVVTNANRRYKEQVKKGWSTKLERKDNYTEQYRTLTFGLLKCN